MNFKLLEGKFISKLMLHFIFTVFIEKKQLKIFEKSIVCKSIK